MFKHFLASLNFVARNRERKRAERLEEIALITSMLNSMQASHKDALDAMASTVTKTSEAAREQARVMGAWLDSFKPTQEPFSHTLREQDEIDMESRSDSDRAMGELGAPPDFLDLPEEFKIKWILQNSQTEN